MQAESPDAKTRISPLKPEQVSEEMRKTYLEIEKALGVLPALFTTMAHLPGAVGPVVNTYAEVVMKSPIEERIQQIAMIRVSVKNDAPYCLHTHMELGLRAGLTHKQIDALRKDPSSGEFTEKEQLVIEYAERLTEGGSAVSDDLFSRLREHFNEPEIVSLTMNICFMAFLTRYTEVFKLHHDH
ncbi:MAG: hypothetical protein COB53_02930 [Elusimicrobia bacterium]|nr:MAG: hypothetical protein COB53_02930 [Elusimicrobiota bacterium]